MFKIHKMNVPADIITCFARALVRNKSTSTNEQNINMTCALNMRLVTVRFAQTYSAIWVHLNVGGDWQRSATAQIMRINCRLSLNYMMPFIVKNYVNKRIPSLLLEIPHGNFLVETVMRDHLFMFTKKFQTEYYNLRNCSQCTKSDCSLMWCIDCRSPVIYVEECAARMNNRALQHLSSMFDVGSPTWNYFRILMSDKLSTSLQSDGGMVERDSEAFHAIRFAKQMNDNLSDNMDEKNMRVNEQRERLARRLQNEENKQAQRYVRDDMKISTLQRVRNFKLAHPGSKCFKLTYPRGRFFKY